MLPTEPHSCRYCCATQRILLAASPEAQNNCLLHEVGWTLGRRRRKRRRKKKGEREIPFFPASNKELCPFLFSFLLSDFLQQAAAIFFYILVTRILDSIAHQILAHHHHHCQPYLQMQSTSGDKRQKGPSCIFKF